MGSRGWAQQEETPALTPKDLWKAVREENVTGVKLALQAGVDVNAQNEYGATALMFAADRGNETIGQLLLDAGADPQIKDSFYNSTPLAWANMNGHKPLVLAMLAKSKSLADEYLLNAINQGDEAWARSLLEKCKPGRAGLIRARNAAVRKSKDEKYKQLPALFDEFDLPEFVPPKKLTPEELDRYVGDFAGDSFNAQVKREGEELKIGFSPENQVTLEHVENNEFSMNGAAVKFALVDQKLATTMSIQFGDNEVQFKRSTSDGEKLADSKIAGEAEAESRKTAPIADAEKNSEKGQPEFKPSSAESLAADRAVSSPNWPSFRGTGARGVAEGLAPPIRWKVAKDAADNVNVKWIAPVPGLGLSSPVIWADHVYITSAVSEQADNQLKTGLYGDVDSVEENFEFDFMLYCFSKSNGKLLWSQKCNSAKPAVKRHAKSSHANPTVATDGKYVVAFFSSEGLYCFDRDGKQIWKQELGTLDSGWFYDASYQWGFGSSPIIFEDRVIVQCDIQEGSFVAAFDLATGKELWRTARKEIPSWSSPTVHRFGDLPMLLTHATKAARGYDARSGKELWSLSRHSEIVVPTPFVAHNLIFVASGYSPIQPIAAIRPIARGELKLSTKEPTTDTIAWSTMRHGPYMPTPIVYGDYLYVCSNAGVLTCYQATTGREVYRKRMTAKGGGLAFTASPLAADGHLYLPAEDGRVLVVKAGPDYELVATNRSGGSLLATPAISHRCMIVRTENRLIALENVEPQDE
jgi:outer membrane protein assembly factor BamB